MHFSSVLLSVCRRRNRRSRPSDRSGRQNRAFPARRLQRALLGGDSFQVATDQPRARQSGRFIRAFRKAQRLQDIASVAEQFRPSPLVGVFEGAVPSSSARWERPAASTTWSPFSAPCRSRLPKRSPASNAMFPGWQSPARSRRLSDCSEPSGASSTPSTASAPPEPQLCAPSLPEFPKLWSPPPPVWLPPSRP
jgi:hypothetical protein